MARRKIRFIGGAGRGGARAHYLATKRAYHEAGNALYKANHGGRSIRSRKRRTKHRRSR